jgi:hypothetical protein
MADQWYFARDGTNFGPFSAAQLKTLAAGQQLGPRDTVWKGGGERRTVASKVKGLFPEARAVTVAPASGSSVTGVPSLAPPSCGPPAPQPPLLAEDFVPTPDPTAEPSTPLADRLARPEELDLAPGEAPVWAPAPSRVPATGTGPGRSTAPRPRVCVRGGTVVSQDGCLLKYRKQCVKCGRADRDVTTVRLTTGKAWVSWFFCSHCRKTRRIDIQEVG